MINPNFSRRTISRSVVNSGCSKRLAAGELDAGQPQRLCFAMAVSNSSTGKTG